MYSGKTVLETLFWGCDINVAFTKFRILARDFRIRVDAVRLENGYEGSSDFECPFLEAA